MARNNPDTLMLLLLLGGAGAAMYFAMRKGGGIGRGGYQIGSGGRGLFWTPKVGPGGQVLPPPTPTASQRAAMERSYRYRFAGGGRCFDYKNRRFVDNNYCR